MTLPKELYTALHPDRKGFILKELQTLQKCVQYDSKKSQQNAATAILELTCDKVLRRFISEQRLTVSEKKIVRNIYYLNLQDTAHKLIKVAQPLPPKRHTESRHKMQLSHMTAIVMAAPDHIRFALEEAIRT